MNFEERVRKFLKSERQWKREVRIGYANSKLKSSFSQEDRSFWQAVISANETEKDISDQSKSHRTVPRA